MDNTNEAWLLRVESKLDHISQHIYAIERGVRGDMAIEDDKLAKKIEKLDERVDANELKIESQGVIIRQLMFVIGLMVAALVAIAIPNLARLMAPPAAKAVQPAIDARR